MSMSTPALCETPTGGGVTPQDTIGLAVFRGVGVPVAKSDGFASVSVHPSPARIAADALSMEGAAPPPS